MNTNISPHEWQMLSAYIDGQLSDRERRQLEARLQTRPELREGLEDLRRTRAILRALPKRRAVRNFTLSSATIPQKPRRNPFPVLRLASALASFLLVMAFLSDLALTTSIRNMAATQADAPFAMEQPAPEEPMLKAPMLATGEEAAAPEEPGLATGATGLGGTEQYYNELGTPYPEEGFGGGAGEPEPEYIPEESPDQTVTGTPVPTLNETEQARIAQTLAPPGMGGGVPEETPPAALAMPAEGMATDQARAAEEESMRSMAAPSPETGEAAPAAEDGAQLPKNVFDPRTVLRPAQIILAIIAAVTGLLALYFHRKSTP